MTVLCVGLGLGLGLGGGGTVRRVTWPDPKHRKLERVEEKEGGVQDLIVTLLFLTRYRQNALLCAAALPE